MLKDAKIFVAGHRGLVGSAIVRRLQRAGCHSLLLAGRDQLDLRSRDSVEAFFAANKPDVVFLAAAKVGGIHANNSYPAQFLFENLQIQNNVIDAAYRHGTKKLTFLGSSCIYPKLAQQPIREEYLLTGPLEPTNEWYAVAKIAGIKMCQAYLGQYGCDFISAMPTNLYGPHDNYDLTSSHVAAALLVKAHQSKLDRRAELDVWGTGTPRREFMYVDDLADALVFLLKNYSGDEHVNVGVGTDVTI